MTVSANEQIARAAAQKPYRLADNADIEVRGVAGKGKGLFWCGPDVPAGKYAI